VALNISATSSGGRIETDVDPSSLLDMYLNMGLSGPTSSTADFAHTVNLTSSSLISVLKDRLFRTMTDLIILGVFGPIGDSSVESEQKTDTVCLDLKALEDGTEERTGCLG
jgi:hypothetical protein